MPNDPVLDKNITSLLDEHISDDDNDITQDTDDDLPEDVKEAIGMQKEDRTKEKVVSINAIVNEDYISADEQAVLEEIDKVDSLI